MTTNQQRILDISKKLGLSHIGSNLSCLPILEEIYANKKPEDKLILSNGHAHLSHLVVRGDDRGQILLSNSGVCSIETLITVAGIHCDRLAGCDASAGSLGHGIGIGIGYALANRKRNVYVIVSDGSLMEGSEWEALRIKRELRLDNLIIYANLNSYTAVAVIDREELEHRIHAFDPTVIIKWTDNYLPEFDGVQGHYKVIK